MSKTSAGIHKLTIVPALFLKREGDKHCIIKCLIDSNEDNPIVEDRKFEIEMIENIDNPKYLFIGIIHADQYVQLVFKDANDYKDMFEEKWGILTI